jgi:hypothetical protein
VPVFYSLIDSIRDLAAKVRGKRTKPDLGEDELDAALAEHGHGPAPVPAPAPGE